MTQRYLSAALLAEGPSDHEFLGPLLPRVLAALAVEAGEEVDVAALIRLDVVPGAGSRVERIVEGLDALRDAVQLVFIHADGQGDAGRSRAERIAPAVGACRDRYGPDAPKLVALVPVRETEAWVLADDVAVCRAIRTHQSSDELGLPISPREIEACLDAKAVLERAVSGRLRTGRRPMRAVDRFGEIARTCDLSRLRRLPAFQAFEHDLRDALVDLGYRALADG